MPPGKQQDQPVPSDWQSTASDLPPAIRRYGPPSYAVVPPQEAPVQLQPVFNVGVQSDAAPQPYTAGSRAEVVRIETDYPSLLLLAISLEKMARDEIDRLSGANDPDTIESNKKQIDLFTILADGFAKIAVALEEYSRGPQPVFAGRTKEIVDWVGAQFKAWWEANEVEARDWCIRLPILTASIGALNLVGADMHFSTPVVSALVGGQKVISTVTALVMRH